MPEISSFQISKMVAGAILAVVQSEVAPFDP